MQSTYQVKTADSELFKNCLVLLILATAYNTNCKFNTEQPDSPFYHSSSGKIGNKKGYLVSVIISTSTTDKPK